MKTVLIALVIILTTSLSAKSQSVEGTYSNKWESTSGAALKYELILQKDGNFTFVSKRTYQDDIPDLIVEASGNWELRGYLLILNTSSGEDNENPLQSNLDMNKARYNTISPRNPNFNELKPSLKFYESDVFYAKNMELIKTEETVTSSD